MKVLRIMRPQVYKVELNEKEYNLCYDMNSFAKMEEVFGSVENALKVLDFKGENQVDAILKLFYIGLLSNSDFNYSFEEVKSMVGFDSFSPIVDLVVKALNSSLPEAEKGGKVKN